MRFVLVVAVGRCCCRLEKATANAIRNAVDDAVVDHGTTPETNRIAEVFTAVTTITVAIWTITAVTITVVTITVLDIAAITTIEAQARHF